MLGVVGVVWLGLVGAGMEEAGGGGVDLLMVLSKDGGGVGDVLMGLCGKVDPSLAADDEAAELTDLLSTSS